MPLQTIDTADKILIALDRFLFEVETIQLTGGSRERLVAAAPNPDSKTRAAVS
jgi:hypothetical protein